MRQEGTNSYQATYNFNRRPGPAGFKHSNYKSVMFLTQTFHLSTAGGVQLEFGNNKRPNKYKYLLREPLNRGQLVLFYPCPLLRGSSE